MIPASYSSFAKLLQTSYKKTIWRPFTRALDEFDLISENDHIAVGFSGGKDSILLSILLQLLQAHSRVPFKLSFIALDPGYSEEHLQNLQDLARLLEIDLDIFSQPILERAQSMSNNKNPCFLCARMRRGALYERARQHGANKLALGHHLDDQIETVLLNVLYASQYASMMPKIPATNFEDLILIRPMSEIDESQIIDFIKESQINALHCSCAVARQALPSMRRSVKELIATLEAAHPGVRRSIYRSAENVALDAIRGYTTHGTRQNFSDIFEENFKYRR